MDAAASQSGSDGAVVDWADVLARHARWLRTVLWARLGDADSVDEVMQEVSLAAIQQQAPIADAAKLPGWLYRVAVRQALLYRRRQGRQRRRAETYAERKTDSPSRTGDPLNWLLASERSELLRQALERLTRRQRELLLLKYTEDWSYRELADHLGISEAAVESRLHRARQRLREELARYDWTEERE
ncbi:MAG: sigma-70 family RNA polymerase sigma factor [Planctomycetes bacterium]|nr:sigma-70 family RNA polymerase sigma factor [Planctomycetota bacterium]